MKTFDPTPVPVRWPRAVADMATRRTLAMWVLIIAAAIPMVDPFVTTTMLIKVGSDLGMTLAEKGLAASLAGLVMACTVLPMGVLGDRIGRKKVFMASMIVVVVGQVVCAAAPSVGVFLGGRALTGLGLAGAYSMSMALVGSMFAPREIGRVFGKMFAMVAGVALVTITAATVALGTNWRLGYLFLPSLALVVICIAAMSVPESVGSHRKFDIVGAALAGFGLLTVIVGLGQATTAGLTSLSVVVPVLLGVASLALMFWYESRIENPSLPIGLLRIPKVSASLLVIVVVNIGVASIALLVPLVTEGSFGWTPTMVLVVTMVMTFGEAVGAVIGGRKPVGHRSDAIYLVGSIIIVAFGLAMAAFATAGSPIALLAVAMFLVGVGVMVGITTAATLVMGNAPKDDLGSAGAIKPVATQVGTALGLGVMAPIMAIFAAGSTGTAVAVATHAFSMTMLFGAVIALVAAAATMYLVRGRARGTDTQHADAMEVASSNQVAAEFESAGV